MNVNRREAIAIGLAGAGTLAQTSAVAWASPAAGVPSIASPRVCGMDAPLSLGALQPRFSWQIADKGEQATQAAYRVTVARSLADLAGETNLLWDSGKVPSRQNFDIAYGGPVLPARSHAVWQVEVWSKGGSSLKSEPSLWETGLGEDPEWVGQWLASETETAKLDRMAGLHWVTGSTMPKADATRFFRTTIEITEAGPAELLVSAHEMTGIWLNGAPLPNPQDGPVHWTVMPVYPIALKRGRNTLAVAVKRVVAFGAPAPALATIVRHGPSLKNRLTSEAGWKTSLTESPGWQQTGYDDSNWESAIPPKAKPHGEPWPLYPASRLRKTFSLTKPLRSARLYVTALGYYEAWLNGGKVGDRRLTPDFTDPSRRVLYQAYDITEHLTKGANTVGLWIADGWYGGKYSSGARFAFGPAPCRTIAQIEIEYADGSREAIATGDGWEIADSPVLQASVYDGEIHDARLDDADWARPGVSGAGWRAAETIATQPPAINPQVCAPIRAHETLRPKAIKRLGNGNHVLDFGQNFAGWPRLTVSAPAGTRIEMRFAELLKSSGEVDQANLRTALQRDVYIAAGRGREMWEPRFTYHGFRYVEVSGLPADPASWSIEGLVGHQDLDSTGEFRVADPVIRKFWENSVWSQKSNFYGLPTDCPQRDERLGWMGDAEVFWPAAAFNMDVAAYTMRVMGDVRAGQKGNGAFPDCIPPFNPGLELSSPGWADAGIVLPHTAWQQYGDTGVIVENWKAMESYMGWILGNNPDHLWKKIRGADYGDWLSVDANPANPGDATTPKDLIGTAYWAANATMMAQMATAIGDAEAARRYHQLFASIRTAFNTAYVKPDGSVGNNSQTSHILAIRFGLLSLKAQQASGRQLVADIARREGHLSTGFLGTPHILDALAMAGQEETAVGLLLQRSYPSWGYMVTQGATTMWERWNSDQGDTGMNSRNHYAFGAIGSFLFRRIAGIAPAAPGFAQVRIAPIIDERLGEAGATYRSTSGPIATDWQAKDGNFRLDIELPPNASANVVLPDGKTAKAGPGLHRYSGKLRKG